MPGLGRLRTVSEREAEGEVARVYHEIREVLRVSGVNLIFRRLAAFPSFPVLWEALRPALGTRGFFEAADRVRTEAVHEADRLGRLGAAGSSRLDETQADQVRAALALYHDVNPKLLVIAPAARMALEGETVGRPGGADVVRVAPGIPELMFPMKMVPEDADEESTRTVFDDIKKTLDLSMVNSDYRTLALWPGYLAAVWQRLKPIVQSEAYGPAAERLRQRAREAARFLPVEVRLTRDHLEQAGDDADEVIATLRTFERVLAPLILNVTLAGLDWHEPGALTLPPFPPPAVAGMAVGDQAHAPEGVP